MVNLSQLSQSLVSFATVFCGVTLGALSDTAKSGCEGDRSRFLCRHGEALRDETKNGCVKTAVEQIKKNSSVLMS